MGVFRRSGAAEQRPRSCSGIIPATPSEWSRRSASLRCSTRHGCRLRNSAQGKGPIGCATAECRRAECSGRPPRSGCDFLPLRAGRHAPSHARALAVLGAPTPTQWRSVFGSVKDIKGPSLPYARACAVVPRLPEPSAGDASLYVVCMLRTWHGVCARFSCSPPTVFFFFFFDFDKKKNFVH